ncbi:hypothetical protein [Corynebacterium propinquum]|uniref:Nucleotidyl transferase AbiEii/AbiGii toxin family protein n=1 Tax=Corynebacterium propinquum TaxID=43769 RepID=A0ABT7G3R6_9CORY|nr:hypothetical protein [Corynebacterium propinquum]MDK4301380.1 hypothetical protein [Corynebacterium propinquum]MDK4314319.1 hypothetical protein [Corynebacterium propinquum]
MRRIDLPLVSEISQVLDGTDWLLVGGMMVHAHCLLAEVSYTRSTSDVDVLVESAPESLPQIKARLEGAGFVAQPNFEGTTLHRFRRLDGRYVDVLVKDRQRELKWDGYRTIQCPGSSSALGVYNDGTDKEVIELVGASGFPFKVPNIWSAIALKGRAYRQPSADISRHLRDAIALFACSTVYANRELTKSENQAFNYLLSSSELSDLEMWEELNDEEAEERAVRGILSIRKDRDLRLPRPLRDVEEMIRQERGI